MRIFKNLFCLMVCMMVCLSMNNYTFSENEKKVIRVPDYQMTGFNYTDDNNVRSGYGYEILQEFAKYTDWTYEYVKCDRSECFDLLEKGEIDLLDTCVYTEERARDFDYSNINAGYGNKAVIIRADNYKYNPNDFENYNGITIGIVDEDFWKSSLIDFCRKKNFLPIIVKFSTYEEKFAALENKEVDAVLTMSPQKTRNEKIIFEFDSTPYYFTVKKGNAEVLQEINRVMDEIWNGDSAYFTKLYNKYHEKAVNSYFFLNDEEENYIKNNRTIKAAAFGGREPLSYFEDGEYKGIVRDILNKIVSTTGLNIEYIEADSYNEALDMVKSGKADIICDFYSDFGRAEEQKIAVTAPYMDIQYNAVVNLFGANGDRDVIVAYVNNYFISENFLFRNYTESQRVLYESEEECIKAVDRGEADITYAATYIAEKVVNDNDYNNISMTLSPNFKHSISIGVGGGADRKLISILDKAVKSIDDNTVNYIISKHTMFKEPNVNIKTFISRNPIQSLLILSLLFIFIIGVIIYIFKMKRKYDEDIFKLAYIDKVTGIWNVNRFTIEAIKKIASNDFKKKKYILVSFDISKFRIINEHYGRFVGDRVLRHIAEKLLKAVGYGSIVARMNMDNFIVLSPFDDDEVEKEFFKDVWEKLRYYEEGGVALKLNFQCGVYLITENDIDINMALDMAEIARKEARSVRKDKVVFFDKKMEQKIVKYKEIEERMEIALEKREFIVYYQPKFDMESEKIVGAEALVRWISETSGFMNPGDFIPVFEKEGFIIELDFYVLEEVFKIIKDWMDNGKNPITISVNQSRVHLSNPYYIERLKNLIKKYQVPTRFIELELTESVFMEIDAALETVNKIKELGFMVSVDDFGSGFSSLNMLKSMPIDVVKIDREFLNESGNSEKAKKIISKIVEMATDLDMNVICEGVEKVEQADFLKSIGCFCAQGFLYAKPMPETEFRDRVKDVIDIEKEKA